MAQTAPFLRLTYEGAAAILSAAVAKASDMGVPQCITVVDSGGQLITMARMDGAFALSIDTALRKAQTAACYGGPTGHIPEGADVKLAIATKGKRINLPGGLPIIVDGHLIGGIGVGSGSGAQDLEVAKVGIAALAGAQSFD